jgi:hypothetical protein
MKFKDALELKRIKKNIKDIKNIQGKDGNWNYDHYMTGLYNGIEVCDSIINKTEPKFKETTL